MEKSHTPIIQTLHVFCHWNKAEGRKHVKNTEK